MTLTKKHYEAIANVLYYEIEHIDKKDSYTTHKLFNVCRGLARYFEEDNPLFKRDLFLKKCGVV